MADQMHKQTTIPPSSPIGGGGAVRPAAGTLANPVTVNANRRPAVCLIDECEGRLTPRGNLWLCESCGAWFTWAGPLSDDDRLILEERAAIREFDAGMTREQAEAAAALEYFEGVHNDRS